MPISKKNSFSIKRSGPTSNSSFFSSTKDSILERKGRKSTVQLLSIKEIEPNSSKPLAIYVEEINSLLLVNYQNSLLNEYAQSHFKSLQRSFELSSNSHQQKYGTKNEAEVYQLYNQMLGLILEMRHGHKVQLSEIIELVDKIFFLGKGFLRLFICLKQLKALLLQFYGKLSESSQAYKSLFFVLIENDLYELSLIALRGLYRVQKRQRNLEQSKVILKKILKFSWLLQARQTQLFVYCQLSQLFNYQMDRVMSLFFNHLYGNGLTESNIDYKQLGISQLKNDITVFKEGVFISADQLDLSLMVRRYAKQRRINSPDLFKQTQEGKRLYRSILSKSTYIDLRRDRLRHFLRGPVRCVVKSKEVAIKHEERLAITRQKGYPIRVEADSGLYPVLVSHQSCIKSLQNYYSSCYRGEFHDLSNPERSWPTITYLLAHI